MCNRWTECIAKYQPTSPNVKLTFDDVAMYQYTGGTPAYPRELSSPWQSQQTVKQINAWFPTFGRGKESCWGPCPTFTCSDFLFHESERVMGWNQVLIPRPQPNL
jgi:long-chain acyl-CoA synthetase